MITNEIKAIVSRLQQSTSPLRIYLFGSFARGEERSDSDYDFYIVVPDYVKDRIAVSQTAYRSLHGVRHRPVDIVVGSESGFETRKSRPTLEKIVATEGVVLYER